MKKKSKNLSDKKMFSFSKLKNAKLRTWTKFTQTSTVTSTEQPIAPNSGSHLISTELTAEHSKALEQPKVTESALSSPTSFLSDSLQEALEWTSLKLTLNSLMEKPDYMTKGHSESYSNSSPIRLTNLSMKTTI